MKEVSLKIIADAGDYLKQAQQVSDVTQETSDEVKANYEQQAEAIQFATSELEKLQKKQFQLFDQYKKSGYKKMPKDFKDTGEAVKYLEKNLDALVDSQQELVESSQELTKEQVKSEKAHRKTGGIVQSLTRSMTRMALRIGITSLVVGTLTKIITSSQRAIDFFKEKAAQATAVLGQFGKAITSGNFKDFAKNLLDAARGAKELYQNQKYLLALQNQMLVVNAALSSEAVDYKNAMDDESASMEDRIENAQKFYDVQAQLIENSSKLRTQAYENARDQLIKETKLTEDQIIGYTENAEAINANREALDKYLKLQWLSNRYAYDTEMVKEYRTEIEGIEDSLNGVFTGTSLENIAEFYKQWLDGKDKVKAEFAKTLAEVRKTTEEEKDIEEDKEKTLAAIRDKANKDRIKKAEEFIAAIARLQEDYDKARLQSLTGEEAIRAQLEFQLREIEETEKHLQSLGTLTVEHREWLSFLRKKANDDALASIKILHKEEQDAIVEQNRITQELAEKRSAEELEIERDRAKRISDLKSELRIGAFMLLKPDELKKAEFQLALLEEELKEAMTNMNNEFQRTGKSSEELVLQIKLIQQAIAGVNDQIDNLKEQEKFSIWKLLGIDEKLTGPEQDDIKAAMSDMVNTWVGVTDQIFAQRVSDAQRTRELLTDQIDFTQDALANEIELMKLGYANNVDAKRKELEELKKQREKAIKDEEKAIKAQKALDTVLQISSLVTASANIFKALSKAGPVGVIAAIATIAAMFGAFAVSKAKAASAVKLAEGGTGDQTGVITGRRHSQGGERFLDHVEVEGGERWGVLSRRASMKYGNIFDNMVTSLNRGKLPIVNNNVVVDTDKTANRLVRVENELVKLNRYFSNKADVQDYGSFRIEKSGHTTRIIRKNV